MTRPTCTAMAAFAAHLIEIEETLARLNALATDHFGKTVDVTWDDVAELGRISELLKRATDVAFGEGADIAARLRTARPSRK